jgi:cell division protein FtsB
MGVSMKIFSRHWGPILVGITILYLMVTGNRGLWRLYELQKEKQTLNTQIRQLQTDINRYQEEVSAVGKNPAILEKQAREELNLVRPGDVIYKFSGTKPR